MEEMISISNGLTLERCEDCWDSGIAEAYRFPYSYLSHQSSALVESHLTLSIFKDFYVFCLAFWGKTDLYS